MVHAQATDASDSTAKPAAAKTAPKTERGNPLFRAVRRELSKLKGTKKPTQQKTSPQKTTRKKLGLLPIFSRSKSKTVATSENKSSKRPTFNAFRRSSNSAAPKQTRQPIKQVAGNQPLPSLDDKPTSTRQSTTTRTRKPGLLDRLLGRDKPRTRPRRITTRPDAPKRSSGIPGLLPSFLRPKSKEQVTARRLPTRSQTQQRTASKQPTSTPRQAAIPTRTVDDLDNAFPELTEAEADKKDSNPFTELTETKPEPQVEENPFSRLKLDESKETELPVVQSASGTSEEKPVLNANSDAPLPLETAEEPKSQPEENAHEDKLKRLADREAKSGFKGFCPVALRDLRDLIDADTEITSSYEDKTYSFSTDEAKVSFDADPAKYAPIHGGHDVIVLTEGNVELEGTLENAVWFKDRLYLFSSTATLETFVGNPTKYAANSPEESTQADTETVEDADPFADIDLQDNTDSQEDTETQNSTNPFDDMDAELPTSDDE
jgi:YHS domain-containing protein